MKLHICKYCHKEIKKRDQLVTGTSLFRLRPFHSACFDKLLMENKTMWTSWKQVNGEAGNIRALLMLALIIWVSFWNQFGILGPLLILAAVYPVVLRIMSFVLIERRIPKQ
ncbi:hypothetical protein [Radiobacillus sp. PE A8.2]|uniref:hypothetical protein n=1 Tax=Radiobacillus sp. PE A8.2 TaxID=3380349 RepID=UPI00388F19DE